MLEKIKEWLGVISPSKLANKDCNYCKYRRTMDCPNSSLCYATFDKPYFKSKFDRE